MKYRKRTVSKGPLPGLVVDMVEALEVIDNTETRNGWVPGHHIAKTVGIPYGSLAGALVTMKGLGILEGRTGCMGGYRRLRKASIEELCSIVTSRYKVDDPEAWGPSLTKFHGKFKALFEVCLV